MFNVVLDLQLHAEPESYFFILNDTVTLPFCFCQLI